MRNKRVLCLILACLCIAQATLAVQATSISDLQSQKKDTQNKLDEINDVIDELAGEQGDINGEMDSVNADLVDIIASVSIMEDDIAAKEEQIIQAQADYDVAKADEDAQYEAMKIRIKFMYEKGDMNYVELFMQASSFSDMLNKADYIEKLYEYDRELLTKFQETRQKVADLKDTLEEEQSELETAKEELEEEKAAMEEQLAELKAVSDDYAVQIAQAKQEAQVYKTKIKQQNDQIAKLQEEERKRAEEAKKKAEEEAKKNNKNNTSSGSSSTPAGTANFDTSQIYSASGSDTGKKVAAYACSFIGNPYVAGGTSLTNGADCSGFTQAVYRNMGYSIPRNSYSQRSAGREVSYAEAEPGDIICYAGHVALYIGNGRIVHASTARTGIKLGYAGYRQILSVRRIVN